MPFGYDPLTDAGNPQQGDTPGPSMLDYGKEAASGLLAVPAGIAAVGQRIAESNAAPSTADFFRGAASGIHDLRTSIDDSLTPGGKDALANPQNHPAGYLGMQLAGLVPQVALTLLAPEGVVGAAAVGGAMQVGNVAEDALAHTNAMTDQELAEQVPAFKFMLENGLDTRQARAELNRTLLSYTKMGVSAGVGAVAGGGLGHVIQGNVTGGLAKRALIGMGVDAPGMGIQSAQSDIANQDEDITMALRGDYDVGQTARAGVIGAATGGAFGAAGGVLRGHNPNRSDAQTQIEAKKPPQRAPVATVEESAPDAAQTAAIKEATTETTRDTSTPPAPPEPPAPEPPAPEPTPEPTPEAPATPPQPVDGEPIEDQGRTVPEAPETFEAQVQQLVEGNRAAVLFPKGTKAADRPERPEGMKLVTTKDGTFYFDPDRIKAKDIIAAAKEGKLNEVLELGPVDKTEAVERANAGETPVAVTERTPEGTEVKAAAGTDQTAPAQVEHLENTKTEGNTVQVEAPEKVLADRAAAAEEPTPEATPEPAPEPAPEPEVAPKTEFQQKVSDEVDRLNKLIDANAGKPIKLTKRTKNGILTEAGNRLAAARDKSAAQWQQMFIDLERTQVAMYERAMQRREASGEPFVDLRTWYDTTLPEKLEKRKQERDAQKANPTEAPAETQAEEPVTQQVTSEEEDQHVLDSEAAAQRTYDFAVSKGVSPERAQQMAERAREAHLKSVGVGVGVGDSGNTKAAQTKVNVGKNRTKKEIAERQRLNDEAQKIVEAFPPVAGEENFGAKGTKDAAAARAQLVERAQAMVAAAEKLGLKIPGKFKDNIREEENFNHYALMLMEAKALAKRKVNTLEHYQRFVSGEMDLRSNDENKIHELIQQRRAEGEMAMKPEVADGSMGGDGEKTVDKIGEATASATQEASADPLENLLAKEDRASAGEDDHPVSDGSMGEGNERAKVAVPDDAVTGYTREKTVPVTDSKGRWEVTPEGKKVFRRPKTVQMLDDGKLVDPITGESATPLQTSPAHELLGKLDLDALTGTSGALARAIRTAFMRVVPEGLNVHILDGEDFKRVIGRPDEGAPKAAYITDGLNDPYIVIRDDVAASPKDMLHAILHETSHSLMRDALDQSPNLKKAITRMMGIVERNLRDSENPADAAAMEYAIRENDPHEFLAEAFSNPKVQDILSKLQSDPILNAMIGLDKGAQGSLFDSLKAMLRSVLEKMGLPSKATSLMEASLKIGDNLIARNEAEPKAELKPEPQTSFLKDTQDAQSVVRDPKGAVTSQVTEPFGKLVDFGKDLAAQPFNSNTRTWGLKWLTMHQLSQSYDKVFGNKDLIHNLWGVLERSDKKSNALADPGKTLSRELIQASHQYPKEWGTFETLMQEARVYSAHPGEAMNSPANAHLAKDSNIQGQEKYADLRKTYEGLPKPMQELFNRVLKHTSEIHDQYNSERLESELARVGIKDAAIHKAIQDGTLTDAQKKLITEKFEKEPGTGKALMESPDFKKVEGPYTPLKRHGDFVVQAEHNIMTPEGARRLKNGAEHDDGNTFEFTDEGKARAFVKGLDMHAETERVFLNPDKGTQLKGDKLTEALADKKTFPNGLDERIRVRVDPKHVEFHESEREARASREALAGDDRFKNVKEVDRRSTNPNIDLEISSPQLREMIKGIQARGDMTLAAKEAAIEALRRTSIVTQRGNRIMKSQLNAKKISGADTDLVRNLMEYNQAMARARARLEFEPQSEAAMTALRDYHRVHEDDSKLVRADVLRSLEDRIYSNYSADPSGAYSQFVNTLMTVSFMKRMASPAHLLLHMTHPWMISAPVLAARHTMPKTMMNLTRAYRDMGAGGALAEGFKGAARTAKDIAAAPTDWINHFSNKLSGAEDSARLGRMLKELSELNLIHPDAGMEVHRMLPGRNRAMQALDHVDGVFRQLTGATESINRVAEAIAAYRMEFEKTKGDHAAAVRYAGDTLANSQGLYSRSNRAPIFANPVLRPFLQFKQFPQMIYHLLGRNLYDAFKHEDLDKRKEAAKAFAGVVATHAAMAGALGLPMEVIKAPVMLANALGLTNTNWSDLEDDAMKVASKTFGPQAAEYIMHGMGRVLGVDVHHRLGLNSLFFFGEPRSDKANDLKSWLFDFLGGAPASLAMDVHDGVTDVMHGDVVGGLSKLVPVKAFDDVAKAYKLASEGKHTTKGAETMKPAGVLDTIRQGIGFVPSSVANMGAARAAAYRSMQSTKTDQDALKQAWVNAKGADKVKAAAAIQNYNKSVPREEQISLSSIAKPSQGKPKPTIMGMPVTKHNTQMLQDTANTYNVR